MVNSFTTRSTKKGGQIHVEVCSQCHPFYTGKQKILDSGGRVARFEKRYGKRKGARDKADCRQLADFPTPDAARERSPGVGLRLVRERLACAAGKEDDMADTAPVIEALLAEHADLERQLSDPDLHADATAARRVGRRFAQVAPIVATYRKLEAATR